MISEVNELSKIVSVLIDNPNLIYDQQNSFLNFFSCDLQLSKPHLSDPAIDISRTYSF